MAAGTVDGNSQSTDRLALEKRVSREKKDLAHRSTAIFNTRGSTPVHYFVSRARKDPETKRVNDPNATFAVKRITILVYRVSSLDFFRI